MHKINGATPNLRSSPPHLAVSTGKKSSRVPFFASAPDHHFPVHTIIHPIPANLLCHSPACLHGERQDGPVHPVRGRRCRGCVSSPPPPFFLFFLSFSWPAANPSPCRTYRTTGISFCLAGAGRSRRAAVRCPSGVARGRPAVDGPGRPGQQQRRRAWLGRCRRRRRSGPAGAPRCRLHPDRSARQPRKRWPTSPPSGEMELARGAAGRHRRAAALPTRRLQQTSW